MTELGATVSQAPKVNRQTSPVDVMIITFNERENLSHAINSLKGWVNKIFVLDSMSTDGTQDLAREMGAIVVEHEWEGYARQKNWGLKNLPLESPWVFILDADESITPALRAEIEDISSQPPDKVSCDGFYVNRCLVFLGKKIRHCGYFPSWNLRLFKRGRAFYEERPVHEHMILQGAVGYLRGLMDHEDRRGLEHYIAKHNRYSTLEAEVIHHLSQQNDQGLRGSPFGDAVERRRYFRDKIYPKLPARWVLRFLWMYFFKLGFLDGMTGLRFCLLISTHEMFTALKVIELKQREERLKDSPIIAVSPQQNPAIAESAASYPKTSPLTDEALAKRPTATYQKQVSLRREQAGNREPSTWSMWEKIKRVLWMFVSTTLFQCSFHNWYGWRRMLLRCFGAKIGRDVRIRPSVSIEIPWNLEIDDGAVVGDRAILYALGKIRIGRDSVISQYSHLCAGTHDYTLRRFPLVKMPIAIGNDAWIAADSFIAPGVTVGDGAVVGARSTVIKDVPPNHVVVGSPAKFVKVRELRD